MSTSPAPRQEDHAHPGEAIALDPSTLAQAFESFTHVAGSLESSYALLQGEVARLRHELEIKNRDLAQSLVENRRMRAYLAGILEVLPCGVLVVDSSFRLSFANPEAARLLGGVAEATLPSGPPLPDSFSFLLRQIAGEPDGAEKTWALEAGEKFIAVTCVAQRSHIHGRGERVFILRDVTEQKRLQEEREFARRMQALAEMTAVLAHEIRNPLASLELFAGLIKDATPHHSDVSQWIVHMQAGLRALSATVNNVLHFHSRIPSQLVPLNVVKLLMQTVEFLEPLALQRGMGIRFTPFEKEILVPADAHRLQQVFFNLTINAFRAMPPGKCLSIRALQGRRDGCSMARIDFEDEGVGIAPEQLGQIFNPGFSTVKGSPGLGLAVSKRVIAQHKGKISVESEPGKGTTFSLYLPLLGAQV
ncbi:MAG: two-component system sensor histidine kinase NtrB [Terriglobia bacterium]